MTTSKTLFAFLCSAFLLVSVLGGTPFLNEKEVSRINNAQKEWQAEIPADFMNKTLDELKNLVAAFPPSVNITELIPADEINVSNLVNRKLQNIPPSFDARSQWGSCIGPIKNQGGCGGCWAFAASEVFEDRLCIAGRTTPLQPRSPQFMLDCDSRQSGCNGGNPNSAWSFLATYGTPTEACYPYRGYKSTCRSTCANGAALATRKVSSVLSFNSIASVKAEIMSRGPVETWFAAYTDLLYYKSGIYRPTTSSFIGYHAVKIIGWGTDAVSGNYWIVANSWGNRWGESGFFRIKAGTCQFDDLSHFVAGTV